MPGLRGVSVTAVMSGVLLLTGCQGSSGPRAGADAPSSSSPSRPASAPADATTTTPATTTHTPSPHASAAPARAASPTPARTLPTSVTHPDCRNLTAGNEVKAAVTGAYQRAVPRFVHVQPVPHQFFYGQCGDVRYAATRFEPTPGATHEELVGMQDEGSATKYFRGTPGEGWTYLASDGFPRGRHGCGDVPQIPEALSAAWGNCAV